MSHRHSDRRPQVEIEYFLALMKKLPVGQDLPASAAESLRPPRSASMCLGYFSSALWVSSPNSGERKMDPGGALMWFWFSTST